MTSIGPRLKTAIALAAVLSTMVVGHSSPAQADSISTPFDFVEPHQCTLETVAVDGRLHIVTQTNTNPDGTVNVIVHRDLHGRGEGVGTPSGDTYRYNEDSTSHTKESVEATSIQTFIMHIEFIHMGESLGYQSPELDDVHAKVRIVVVITNGVPNTHVFTDETVCR